MSYVLETSSGKYVRFVGHSTASEKWRSVEDLDKATLFDTEDEAMDAKLYADCPAQLVRTRVERPSKPCP